MQLFTQKLFQKYKALGAVVSLSALILLAPASIALGDETELNEINEQQQKLQKILDEISVVRDQRAEQKAFLEKLSKKMQCNWDLIQDYDACGKKYNEQKQEQLSCVQAAKERARSCLSGIGGHEPTE